MAERGFTLVETIIALTIMAFLFTIIAYIQVRGAMTYSVTRQRVEVQESLRIALNKMSSELREAEAGSIVVGKGGQEISFSRDGACGRFSYDTCDKELEADFEGKPLPFASNIAAVSFSYDSERRFVDIVVRGEMGRSGVEEVTTGIYLRTP